MSDARTEALHLAASLSAELKRNAGRGVRRAPAPSSNGATRVAEQAAVTSSAASPSHEELDGVEELRQLAAEAKDLKTLEAAVASCEACELCQTRTQTVFSDGSSSSGILFVGEAPGADEDAQGVPFVGRAGQFLTRIIENGIGVDRSEVYIANILKCRPPENRDPNVNEKALCTAWLDRQIELVDPKVIVPLGRHASVHLTGKDLPMGKLRGQVHKRDGRAIVPTYHPSYIIRQEGTSGFSRTKKLVWEDIQLAMREAEILPEANK